MYDKDMRTFLLIDANAIIHRAFHALPPLTAKDGRPIQAIYGLTNIFLRLWREERPDYAAALFDRPEPTFREKEYKEYKAQRPQAPDELISQIIEAHKFFTDFGIKTFEIPGYEADDLIATLAEKFGKEKDLRVVILTGDMDSLQLVKDEKIVVRAFKTGISETVTYDGKAVEAKYGLPPRLLVDYKGFVGDPSDNIKGVPGVGPKTAAELVRRYGTVEEIYTHAAEDPKIWKKIGGHKNAALLSKRLNTLDRHAPIAVDALESLRTKEGMEGFMGYIEDLGFEKIIARIKEGDVPANPRPKKAKASKKLPQGNMF